MSNICTTCQSKINWNPSKRQELGIKGPLNEDGLTVHKYYNTHASAPAAPQPPVVEQPLSMEETMVLKKLAAALKSVGFV